jgi:hypothetical protein
VEFALFSRLNTCFLMELADEEARIYIRWPSKTPATNDIIELPS